MKFTASLSLSVYTYIYIYTHISITLRAFVLEALRQAVAGLSRGIVRPKPRQLLK